MTTRRNLRLWGATLGVLLIGCARGNDAGGIDGPTTVASQRDAAPDVCTPRSCDEGATFDEVACACVPPCSGADCMSPVGSCDVAFCPAVSAGDVCCYTPNGPCGADLGWGCGQPEPTGVCDPTFCPPKGRGVPCCMAPAGPCGMDDGTGCVRREADGG